MNYLNILYISFYPFYISLFLQSPQKSELCDFDDAFTI